MKPITVQSVLTLTSPSPAVHETERRRSRRFLLKQPATLHPRNGSGIEINGRVNNASREGVLVCLDDPLPQGVKVDIMIRMRTPSTSNAADLHAAGIVIRTEEKNGKHKVAIACDSPLHQL